MAKVFPEPSFFLASDNPTIEKIKEGKEHIPPSAEKDMIDKIKPTIALLLVYLAELISILL